MKKSFKKEGCQKQSLHLDALRNTKLNKWLPGMLLVLIMAMFYHEKISFNLIGQYRGVNVRLDASVNK